MSDYTPTTEEVRDGYGAAYWYESDRDEVRKREGFDRWLTQHDAEITAQAEKRIIKLLETDCKNGSIEFAIALIKGEQE